MTTAAQRLSDVTLSTGVRLAYAERGAPSGEPLVFLHGFSDSWFSFSPILPLLPSFRCLAPTQRGHGDSDRPERGYAMDDLAADVVAFLDALGIGQATLVGHSMGSLVAQRVVARQPERVARLVLVGGACSGDLETVRGLQQALAELGDTIPLAFVRAFQQSCAHQPLAPDFLDAVVAESAKLPASVWRQIAAGLVAMDGGADLARIACPTLIVWGEHDGVFSRAEQDRLTAGIPHARFVVCEDTGHTPHWEHPERFARTLRAFLASTPTGR